MKTPRGTVPHKDRPVEGIINGRLFNHPRTEEQQKWLSGLYTPRGSETLLLMQSIIESDKQNRIHSQNLVKAESRLPESIPYQVQPPPSDIWGMMRASEPMLRANGDVWQTLLIPAQVMFNKQRPIRINCKDTSAKKVWDQFFDDETGVVPINKWGRDCYLTVEQYGQWFPLEYWKGKDLQGIASLEPTSMWIGHHLGMGYPPMSIVTPEAFDEAKWNDMQHDAAFTTFVNDQNIQTFPAFRIPLPPNVLHPVFGLGKKAFERYSVPHIARAYSHMLYRLMLQEYRQGVLESWISQIFMFVAKGYGNNPPAKGALAAIKQQVEQVIASHQGELIFGYDVTATTIKPEKIDDAMAATSWVSASQTIYTHLGFDVFVINGAVAGEHGRGGGVQVEVSIQVAMERWKSLLVGYFDWCTHIARRFAEETDPALLKNLPTFKIGPSALETQATIEKVVKPMFAAGLLSRTTGLERADENWATELQNKTEEEPHAELFGPPPTFSQTSFGGGGEKTTLQQNPGRPKGNDVEESITIRASKQDDIQIVIAAMFSELLAHVSRDSVIQFVSQLETTLRAQMGAVYAEGFQQQGGFGDIDMQLLNGAIAFQVKHLRGFKKDLLAASPEEVGTMRRRALLYSGALVMAYVLGTQTAARLNGSTGWQRQLHPELSKSGPCTDCIADSAIIHKIDEPFITFHPADVCSMQSIRYSFGDAEPLVVAIPSIVSPNHRYRRAPYGAT